MDCDCSYDPSELKPMLHLFEDGVDLVTASPYHPAGSVLNVPHWRLLLSRCSSALYRIVTGRKIYTFTSCVRVYRRSAAVSVPLNNSGFLGIAELLSRLALQNRKIVEHPATLESRLFGQSKMKIVRNILGHLRLLTQLAAVRMKSHRVDFPTISPRVNTQNTKQSNIVSEVER
jgi:dolichol-phosphate mannosyltransferase